MGAINTVKKGRWHRGPSHTPARRMARPSQGLNKVGLRPEMTINLS